MWFNQKYKNRISEMEQTNRILTNKIIEQNRIINSQDKKGSMADLMRESLGLQVDFSAASTDTCLPPYYLEGLDEDERKNFIIDMESIHENERYQKVVRYLINLFAMNAIYRSDEQERKNGQVAVVAFRTLLKEFDKMHKEFLGYKKVDEDFDPLATMPE